MLFLPLDLSGAEIELSSEPGREYILKELIENVRGSYDYIDSPPSLGLLTINSLLQRMKLSSHCKRNFGDARFGQIGRSSRKNKNRLNKG
jgi:chromosome partitioning protein